MLKIYFKNEHKIVEVERGTTILEGAMDHEVSIYHACGGNASCSTCRVEVLRGGDNLSGIEAPEREILDSFDLKPPYRLGCQALVLGGDIVVEIPKRDKPPRPNKTPRLSEGSRGTY